MDLLAHLQSKSSHVKAYYALGFSSVVTGIIGLVWISTLPARFTESVAQKEVEEQSGIFDTFFEDAKDQLGNVIAADTEKIITPEATHMDMLPTSETTSQETEIVDTGSALGMLGTTASATGTAEVTLIKPFDVPNETYIPIATITENIEKSERTTNETMPVSAPKNEGPKTILIETRDIPKKTILIGTSTLQKVE